MTLGRIGELITIGAALIAGGLWMGSLDNRVQAGEAQLTEVAKEVKATPTQVAVLQTQMTAVQETVKDVKVMQERQGDKLDRILEEVRRK